MGSGYKVHVRLRIVRLGLGLVTHLSQLQGRQLPVGAKVRVTGLQDYRVTYRVTGLQGYIQGYRVTGLQGYRVTGLQGYRVTGLWGG